MKALRWVLFLFLLQSEMEPALLASKITKPELKDDVKPESKKRVPLTTIANSLPAKIK